MLSKKIAQVSNLESKLCIQSFVTQSNDNVVRLLARKPHWLAASGWVSNRLGDKAMYMS